MVMPAGSHPRWVALGSSFASGPGIAPLVDRGAMRSSQNYAHLVAEALGSDLTDVSCAGATTAHLLAEPQRTLTGRRAAQIEAVTHDATHVTVTVGGNDLNFVGSLTAAAARHLAGVWMERAQLPKRLHPGGSVAPVDDAQVSALVVSLVEVARQVRLRAPNARVLLVDYLALIGDSPADDLPMSAADAATLRETEARLSEAFDSAAEESAAELVAISRTSRSHGFASAQPWVTGFSFGVPWRGRIPFHPNRSGMRHAADEILRHLEPATAGSA
jgi:lysophospholipase L1-like esterase